MQNTSTASEVEEHPTLARTKTREHKAAFRDSLLQSEPFAFGTRGARAASSDAIPLARGRSRSVIVESQGGLLRELTRQESNLREADAFENPLDSIQDRVCLAMVGLPARGKSYISKAIIRYLNFIGCPAKLFNAGNKRRTEGLAGTDASFFDASNASAKEKREEMAMETLDELLAWLHGATTGCGCGIFDATNTTAERRRAVAERCARESPHVTLLFVETICDDDEILTLNYRMKLVNDDYRGVDPAKALTDFKERVAKYEAVYQPLDDAEAAVADHDAAFIKMVDAGRKLVVSHSQSRVVASKVLGLLHSIHLGPRTIWLALVGETANDRKGVLGGDSPLSKEGLEYTRAVAAHVRQRERELRDEEEGDEAWDWATRRTKGHRYADNSTMVLCGTLRRYTQTSEILIAPSVGGTRAAAAAADGGGDGGGDGSGDAKPALSKAKTAPPRQKRSTIGATSSEAIAAARKAGELDGAAAEGSSSLPTAEGGVARQFSEEPRRVVVKLQRLNELCAGKLDSLTYEQMKEHFPREYGARAADKLNYRYPGAGGESYQDLILRLQESILMLEQTRGNIIVVCDRAVCRVLLAYFEGIDVVKMPYIDVEPGVLELRRSHSGFSCTHTRVTVGEATHAAGPGTRSTGQVPQALSRKNTSESDDGEEGGGAGGAGPRNMSLVGGSCGALAEAFDSGALAEARVAATAAATAAGADDDLAAAAMSALGVAGGVDEDSLRRRLAQ